MGNKMDIPGYCLPNEPQTPLDKYQNLIQIFSCIGSCRNSVDKEVHSINYTGCLLGFALMTLNNIIGLMIIQ